MIRNPNGDLKEQLDQNARWYATAGAEGSAAYLAFEQHTGMNLNRAVLVSATLQEADFSGSSFDEATLTDALANGLIARECSLTGTNVTAAELVEADFTAARCPGAVFRKARLTNARFDRAVGPEAVFRGAVCQATSFRQADLRRADFSDALLDATDFSMAVLTGTNFAGAHFTKRTRLQDAVGLERAEIPFIFFDGNRIEGPAVWHALRPLTH